MNGKRITLDTNVLVYAIDTDAGKKHIQAMELVDYSVLLDCVLTLQSLCEFYVAVTRKKKMPSEEAVKQIEDWMILFPVIIPKESSLADTLRAVQQYKLSFWDAMLWAVALKGGVKILFSEDFQNGQIVEGVQFINPFADDFSLIDMKFDNYL